MDSWAEESTALAIRPANTHTGRCPVQTLFPGLWLTEITADAYKVPDE